MKSKKKKQTEEEKTGLIIAGRNVPGGNLNTDFARMAKLTKIPAPPMRGKPALMEPIESAEERIKIQHDIIRETRECGGLIIVGLAILTEPSLLAALASCNTIALVDKDSFLIPLLRKYNQIIPGYTRDQLPGNYFNHLVSIGENDYGYIDGVRIIGEYFETIRKRANETRPLFHWKTFLGLKPKGEKKILTPFKGLDGTANGSNNSQKSLERVWYTEDPVALEHLYKMLAWAWAHTEGLHDFRRGTASMFAWESKVQKYKPLPLCQCGKNKYSLQWHQYEGEPTRTHVFRCLHCNSLSNVPV